ICNFLAGLFERGFDFGTVASYRSALSSILQFFGRGRIGEDPLVHKLMKGMEFQRPAKPKYPHFYDVNLILQIYLCICLLLPKKALKFLQA
ncbi:MAG: hypothetical protein ACOVNR_11150, partial [Chitinophagaceae bacterium]